MGPRREEALRTLAEEGIRHETVRLVEGRHGLLLVYALESDDVTRARNVAERSTHAVDIDHRRVLRDALLPPEPLDEAVLDLALPSAM